MPILVRDKSQERAYVKRALRAYPNEYMEILWGVREGENIYIHSYQTIDQLGDPNNTHYGSFPEVDEDDPDRFNDDLELHQQDAASAHVIVVGKIHSHPYDHDHFDDYPSDSDMVGANDEGELVSGICAIGKRENGRRFTRVAYWQPLKRYEVRDYDEEALRAA